MTKLYPPRLFYCKNPFFVAEKSNILEIKSLFEKAVEQSNSINIKPGNKNSLRLYSLYKQATEGDINLKLPSNSFDFFERAKYEAWASLKGKSIKEAQTEYIMLVYKLKN